MNTDVLSLNMVATGSNAKRILQFDGTVRFDGFINETNINRYSVKFPNAGTTTGYACYVRASYVYQEGDNLFTGIYYSPRILPTFSTVEGVYISSVYSELVRFMRTDGIEPIYISSMNVTFSVIGANGDERIYTDSITVSAPIMHEGDKFAYITDIVSSYWYGIGYADGYNL